MSGEHHLLYRDRGKIQLHQDQLKLHLSLQHISWHINNDLHIPNVFTHNVADEAELKAVAFIRLVRCHYFMLQFVTQDTE